MAKKARWLWILASLFASAVVYAGAEKVAWPEGYGSSFVRYHTVDKPKAKGPARVRFFYVNLPALTAAKAGAPLPDGTVLVMEDHLAVLGADGEPVRTANGRFVAGTEITNVFVQEKRAGWGAAYPEAIRNGDWEYARFLADGSPKQGAKFEGCFACHKAKAAGTDFNFTFSPFVKTIKP